MTNVKLDDEKQKAEKQFLIANNPYAAFHHRPESDSEQQYDGHMTQSVPKHKGVAEDSSCCPCVLF